MLMTKNKSYNKHMEVGDRIVLLEPIENGLIKLKQFDEGRIIHLQNQVQATVWFRGIGHYANDDITKVLQLDTSFYKNGKLDGITVQLKRRSFAIKHQYFNTYFENLVVDEDKALTIPFFEKDEQHRQPSNMSRNVGNGQFEKVYQYDLNRIIDVVNDGFEEWVKNNTKTRKIRKSEKENGDFPYDWDRCLTDESSAKFYKKKEEVEIAFAKAIGIFYEFNGGLLFD